MTVQLCEKIENYYSRIAIVFSGRLGFHVYALDFDIRDFTHYDARNPIKSHEVARFRFSKILALETFVYDRSHFILTVDPMRVLSVPNSLNATSGLICSYIGNRKDLEAQTINGIIDRANPALLIHGHAEPEKAMKLFERVKKDGLNSGSVAPMTSLAES